MRKKNFCLVTILTTFALLLLGGFVHNTQSSLACPDWPLCYGQIFPKMEGGVLIEHSHRLLASLVGIFSIILVFLTAKDRKLGEKQAHVYRVSLLALAFVIIQGILGGITVIYRLPTIVSTTHLGLSMIFFSTLVYLHHKLGQLEKPLSFPSNEIERYKKEWDPNITNGIFLSGILVYAQILLGAFMRHAGAGASCGLGFKNSFRCLETNTWIQTFWPSYPQSQLHMIHRIVAVVVTLITFHYGTKAFFKFKKMNLKGLQALPIFIILVIFSQVCLGMVSVGMNLHQIPTTFHLGFGALTLILLWKYTLAIRTLEDVLYPEGVYTFLGDIVDLTKPRLSALVMSTALIGLLIAPEHINFFRALLGMFLIWLVVMGAAALNCYIEKDVDKLMERTKNRPLPSGRMKPGTALAFGLVLLGISIPLLVVTINFATALLGLLAAVLYLFAYTPLKQKSELAVYVGAIPGAIPPIMGWTVVMGTIGPMAWFLFLILFVWQLPHFLAISIYHSNDYNAASIKVYPNLKGMMLTKNLIFIFTILLFAAAVLPSVYGDVSLAYRNAAIALSLAFLLLAGYGYFLDKNEEVHKVWARKYFLASVFYLPLLLCAMIFLK